MVTINPDDSARLQRKLLDKLGVDPTTVERGSVSVEWSAGDNDARVTWTGFATLDAEVFRELFNQSRIRPAS